MVRWGEGRRQTREVGVESGVSWERWREDCEVRGLWAYCGGICWGRSRVKGSSFGEPDMARGWLGKGEAGSWTIGCWGLVILEMTKGEWVGWGATARGVDAWDDWY